ncbi:hypothetical protein RJ641_003850 [Dillenia turbinata]|uniref:RRM domain-containing protein n=1 Tax=Dillenia turbinata TaxID=194707 RepID=A0AAN8VHA2_9MAGN
MVLYRLLPGKTRLHFLKIGFEKPRTRRYSASFNSESESQSKNSEAANKWKVGAVESNKSEGKLGDHLEAAEIRAEFGGSWNTFKGVFINQKEMVLGNDQTQKSSLTATSELRHNATASDLLTESEHDDAGKPENKTQTCEAVPEMDCQISTTSTTCNVNSAKYSLRSTNSDGINLQHDRDKTELSFPGNIVEALKSVAVTDNAIARKDASAGSSCKDAVGLKSYSDTGTECDESIGTRTKTETSVGITGDVTAFEVRAKHDNSEDTEVTELMTVFQSSESQMGSHSDEKNMLPNASPYTSDDISSGGPGILKMQQSNKKTKIEAISNTLSHSVSDEDSRSKLLSRLRQHEEIVAHEKDGLEKKDAAGNDTMPLQDMTVSFGHQPCSKGGELPDLSCRNREGLFDKHMVNQREKVISSNEGGKLAPDRILSNSGDLTGKKAATNDAIHDFLDYIRVLPFSQPKDASPNDVKPNGADERSENCPKRKAESLASRQSSHKGCKMISKGCNTGKGLSVFSGIEGEPSTKNLNTLGAKSMSKEDAGSVLDSVSKPEPTPQEGLKKALTRTDQLIKDTNTKGEYTSFSKCMPDDISCLVSDLEVPVALVKNPSRTVMIKGLAHNINSHHLKDALSIYGSISGIFFGSSCSVAYVEFEIEDAKEQALSGYTISVLGKQLLIYRIDPPRTTVVRISNINKKSSQVLSICKSCGKVNQMQFRLNGPNAIADVHFSIEEWPNMLNILNKLNGMESNGGRWTAQPAPIFPRKIFKVLWNQPEGRRYLKSTIQELIKTIEKPLNSDCLSILAAKYRRDDI